MGNFVLKNVALPMCVDGKQTEHETKEKLTPFMYMAMSLEELPSFGPDNLRHMQLARDECQRVVLKL